MSKPKRRVTEVIAMAVFAVVAMTVAFADTNRTRQATHSEVIPASPSATPPAKKKTDNEKAKFDAFLKVEGVEGTCNTASGCAALRDACRSVKNHSFKATAADGSLGVCNAQLYVPTSRAWFLRNSNSPNQPPTNPAADAGLAAPRKTSEATLYCNSVALCTKVKNACKVLKGEYTSGSGSSGQCVH